MLGIFYVSDTLLVVYYIYNCRYLFCTNRKKYILNVLSKNFFTDLAQEIVSQNGFLGISQVLVEN